MIKAWLAEHFKDNTTAIKTISDFCLIGTGIAFLMTAIPVLIHYLSR